MTLTQRLLDGSLVVVLMKRLEGQRALDSLTAKVAPVVDQVIAPAGARPVLQGQWLGHASVPHDWANSSRRDGSTHAPQEWSAGVGAAHRNHLGARRPFDPESPTKTATNAIGVG